MDTNKASIINLCLFKQLSVEREFERKGNDVWQECEKRKKRQARESRNSKTKQKKSNLIYSNI